MNMDGRMESFSLYSIQSCLDTDYKNLLIYSVYALYLNLVVKSLRIVLLGTNIFESNGFLLKEHLLFVVVFYIIEYGTLLYENLLPGPHKYLPFVDKTFLS